MLAKIKEAKKIRDTLAAENELSGPDNVGLTLLFFDTTTSHWLLRYSPFI